MEVAKDGSVRVKRVVCAVDCGQVVNPDTVRAQLESGVIFGITAALYGEITLKDGRVEQSNFDNYRMLRIDEAPKIEVYIVESTEAPGGMGEPGTSAHRARGGKRRLCRNGQAAAQAADRRSRVEAGGLN